MKVTIANGEATLSLSEPQEVRMIEAAATAYAKEKAEQDALSTVYTLLELTQRMKMSRSTLFKYLKLPVAHGGIRYRLAGNKYIVSEQAVREWFGDR